MIQTTTTIHINSNQFQSIGFPLIVAMGISDYIKVFAAIFHYDIDKQLFYPIEGKTLGILLQNKTYTYSEIINLYKTINIESIPYNLIDDSFIEMQLYFSIPVIPKELAISSEIVRYEYSHSINYPSTISFLKKKYLVETQTSSSFMTTDGRQFRLAPEFKNELTQNSIIKEYVAMDIDVWDWWEVDILGTQFGREISKIVDVLYENIDDIFKSSKY